MAEERLGASFTIDTTALKAGLTQANRLIKESESQFKAAAAGMDDWSNSQEGLEARIKHLNTAQDLQKKKVEALKKQYEEAGYSSDDMSAAAVNLRTQINKEQEALNKTEKELRQQKEALEKLEDSSEDAADSLEDVKDAAEKSGDGFTVAKGAIAGFIANGLTSLVGACKNAIGSIVGLAESTREYREDIGKLETAFESAGKSTELATKTYKDLYAVLGEEDRSVEAVNHLAKFVETEEDMAEWTDILTGVWGTFGDSLPIEGLTEAANETAKVGKLTGVLADALNWAGVNEDDFQGSLDACNSESERASLIQKTLNGLYSEAADNYKENNKGIMEARYATSEYTDNMATLGEIIEPITTKVRNGFNKILEKVIELTEGIDFDSLSAKIDKAFETFIDSILPAIIGGLEWIIKNKDGLISGIIAIGAAFAAFKVVSLIQSVVTALKGMTLAQSALNLAMSLNPIGLVVAAVTGLVVAIVLLWKKSEKFRNFWKGLWKGIKNVTITALDGIKKAYSSVVKFFTDVFTNSVEGIKKAWSGVESFFAGIWKGITSVFSGVSKWFGEIFSSAYKAVTSAFNSAYTFFSGVWTSIRNVFSSSASWFGSIFSQAWTNVKNAFSGVASFFGSLWNTITSRFTTIGTDIATAIGGAFRTAMNSVLGTIESTINKAIGLINGAIKIMNKIPKVNIKTVGTISLPRLAKGGVVNKATTAVIGEDGAEAVVPLERNKQWIREVAKEIALTTQQNGNSVVVNQTNNYSQAHSRLEIYKSKQATAAAVRLAMGRA